MRSICNYESFLLEESIVRRVFKCFQSFDLLWSCRMEWLWVLALQLYVWSGPLITFWYPVIASFVAIGSSNKTDDKLWITYWMLYSLVSTVELIAGPVIAWIPFYATIKFLIASWLVLPQFRGAIVFYEEVVRPHFNFCFNIATEVTFTDGERKWSAYISPDTNASAALYIKKNGTDAFEALMKLATKSIKLEDAVKVEKIEEVEEVK